MMPLLAIAVKCSIETREKISSNNKKNLIFFQEPSRQRWYFGGKLLGDKLKMGDANIPSGYVVQCVVSHLDFDVIQTKD
jgi:hypothetical protein